MLKSEDVAMLRDKIERRKATRTLKMKKKQALREKISRLSSAWLRMAQQNHHGVGCSCEPCSTAHMIIRSKLRKVKTKSVR